MSDRQTSLGEFGASLAATRTDSSFQWAEVVHATPIRREQIDESVDPSDDGAADEGLAIKFERASGKDFTTWLEKPDDWDIIASDLVLLFEFWDLHPGEIERLTNPDEEFEVPISYNSADGVWRPAWDEIARSTDTQQREEVDDE